MKADHQQPNRNKIKSFVSFTTVVSDALEAYAHDRKQDRSHIVDEWCFANLERLGYLRLPGIQQPAALPESQSPSVNEDELKKIKDRFHSPKKTDDQKPTRR